MTAHPRWRHGLAAPPMALFALSDSVSAQRKMILSCNAAFEVAEAQILDERVTFGDHNLISTLPRTTNATEPFVGDDDALVVSFEWTVTRGGL